MNRLTKEALLTRFKARGLTLHLFQDEHSVALDTIHHGLIQAASPAAALRALADLLDTDDRGRRSQILRVLDMYSSYCLDTDEERAAVAEALTAALK